MPSDIERKLNKKTFVVVVVVAVGSGVVSAGPVVVSVKTSALLTRREGQLTLLPLVLPRFDTFKPTIPYVL